PDVVVTVTSIVPTTAGVVAVICESELTVNEVAGIPLKRTDDAFMSPLPVMTTIAPPAAGPAFGDSPETAGPSVAMYTSTGVWSDVPPSPVTWMCSGPDPAGLIA